MVEINNKDAEKGINKGLVLLDTDETRHAFFNAPQIPIGDTNNLTILADASMAIENPTYRSLIYINNDKSTTFSFLTPRPNLWWRLWHWVFFGIKWEKL